MNIIERQTELGKSLYEINTSTLKSTSASSATEKYVEMNREFGAKLPEPKTFLALWSCRRNTTKLCGLTKSSFKAQSELFKGAFSNTREALKTAYTFETEEKHQSLRLKRKQSQG